MEMQVQNQNLARYCQLYGINPIPARGDPLTEHEQQYLSQPAPLDSTTLTVWIKLGIVKVHVTVMDIPFFL